MAASSQILIFVAVIALALVFRFRKIVSGGPVSRNRIIFSMASYFGISLFAMFGSFQVGVSIWYVFAYAGILIGATWLSNRLVGNRIKVWQADDGKIHAKGGAIPYVIWLVGLVSRFAIGYAFIGPDYIVNSYGLQKTFDAFTVQMTLAVDLIMMLGVGALAGRNIKLLSMLQNLKVKK